MLKKSIPFVMAIALLGGCKNSAEAPAPTTATTEGAAQTLTATAKKQDLVGYSFFDGKLVVPATAQATAYSPFETPVESVPTSLGKYVERGQTIVKLTIPGADDATNAAKAGVSTAKAALATEKSTESGPVKDAEQALSDARAAERAARDTIAAGGTADLEALTMAREQAEETLKQAQQQVNETLAPTKEAVSISAAQLAQVQADARKGYIRAPISGTIVTLEAKPGMDAKAKQNLATIVNYRAVRVQGTVPADLKDTVKRDSRVIVALSGASSDPIDGRVTEVEVIPPSSGQTSPGYLAVIRFENPREIAQPPVGVKRIGVRTGSVKDAVVVPVGAVTKKDGKSFVSVQKGSDWVETPVEVGISDGALVEIKSGLSEGAVVRVVGQTTSG